MLVDAESKMLMYLKSMVMVDIKLMMVGMELDLESMVEGVGPSMVLDGSPWLRVCGPSWYWT